MAELDDALQPGERAEFAVKALIPTPFLGVRTSRDGIVAVTTDRVIFFTPKVGGFVSQAFEYDLIASVDFKKGMRFGELDIAASGDHIRAIHINKDHVEELARRVKAKMRAAKDRGAPQASAPPPAEADPADQIRKMAALRDEGLLTDEEFQAKKAQILGL